MYLIGCHDRYIDRCIDRYIMSIDYRPRVDRCFHELPLMSAEVSTVTISGAYRSTTGGISVNHRRNVGRISLDSRARVYRYYVPIYRTILSTNISTYTRYYLPIYRPLLSTDPRYYRPMYRPIYWLILDPIHWYIDRYQILSTGTRNYRPMYRPMYRQMHRPILEHLSTARLSVKCRPMYELKYRWSIGAVSVKYQWGIGEVSVNHQVYRPIGVSVDTLVDTQPIYRPILDRVSTDSRSSIDRCIDRYIDRCIGGGPP